LYGEVVEAVCRSGKHLLIEKPLAPSLDEAIKIYRLINASQIRCMVAQTFRFNSVVQAIRSRLSEIVPLHSIYLSQRFEPAPSAVRDDPVEYGRGIMMNTGIHSFDLLRYLSECEVNTVWCQTTRILTKHAEDNYMMMCRMSDPKLVGIAAASRSTHSRTEVIEIAGERGQLVGDAFHGMAHLIKGGERFPIMIGSMQPTVREGLRAFVNALLNDLSFPITPDDGLRAVAVAEACSRSVSNQGQPVEVKYSGT
jgi:predicted dehydrogenase